MGVGVLPRGTSSEPGGRRGEMAARRARGGSCQLFGLVQVCRSAAGAAPASASADSSVLLQLVRGPVCHPTGNLLLYVQAHPLRHRAGAWEPGCALSAGFLAVSDVLSHF